MSIEIGLSGIEEIVGERREAMAKGKAGNDVHPDHGNEEKEQKEDTEGYAVYQQGLSSHTWVVASVLFTASMSIANHLFFPSTPTPATCACTCPSMAASEVWSVVFYSCEMSIAFSIAEARLKSHLVMPPSECV